MKNEFSNKDTPEAHLNEIRQEIPIGMIEQEIKVEKADNSNVNMNYFVLKKSLINDKQYENEHIIMPGEY